MDKDFWIDRWQQNMIGFHLPETNPLLIKYFKRLEIVDGDTVFVPLCGKSLDLAWIQSQGNRVIGVEVSPLAVTGFFKEQNLQASIVPSEKFDLYRSGDIEIFCGDFFELNTSILSGTRAVIDRAALIALPKNSRVKYASKMAAILASGSRILLITLEYPESEMSGPPYSVGEAEVKDLYADNFSINVLETNDILAKEEKFQQRGLSRLIEAVYLLQKI